MRLIFEFAGEEIDVAEELQKIAAEQAAKLAGMQQRAPVPNQQSLDRQSAQQEPLPVGSLNAYGHPMNRQVYGETFGDDTKRGSAT